MSRLTNCCAREIASRTGIVKKVIKAAVKQLNLKQHYLMHNPMHSTHRIRYLILVGVAISSSDNCVVTCCSCCMYPHVLCVQFMLAHLFAPAWVSWRTMLAAAFLKKNKCLLCIEINTLGLEGDEPDPCEHFFVIICMPNILFFIILYLDIPTFIF